MDERNKTNPHRPVLPPDALRYQNVPYVAGGHERQKLDLYLPGNRQNTPLIIWVPGSSFQLGRQEDQVPFEYLFQGYAVARIGYRLSQEALFPAQIEDCKAAVRWLRWNADLFSLNPERFGAWGESAGGHWAALLGTTGHLTAFEVGENLDISSQVQAVVAYFGPAYFLQLDAQGLAHNTPDAPESMLVGGPIQELKDQVAQANPMTYVTASAPPFLIVHGDSDAHVTQHQSERLAAALKKAGVPVTLCTAKSAGHGGFTDPEVHSLTRVFLATHLQPEG
jgi:acetyl esterase/lipase